jgi:pyrimidine-nucleoside phosphorylase
MVEAQGGDPRVVDEPGDVLPEAPVVVPVTADLAGFLAVVDAEAIGRAAVSLGAGRARKGDPIDPAVGFVFRAKVGDRLEMDESIGEVHARDEGRATEVARELNRSLAVVDHPVDPPPLVYSAMDSGGG